MLTEHFIASVGVPTKAPAANTGKDAAVFIQEYQPLNVQRDAFKKSATLPGCLAVSDSHIFAAQVERPVIHVYNRRKGNQEATVPFSDPITCISLACNGSVLLVGTADGRIILWETASGRQVIAAQSHLQAVTAIVVDSSSNFLLSASADSTIHVQSLPSLLSFSNTAGQLSSTLRTLTSHRAKVNALVLGNSSSFSNFAVSASADKTCLVWEYNTGTILRTYLLPAVPLCLALDAADRGVYVGYEDGSVQQLDFFMPANDRSVDLTGISDPRDSAIQPSQSSRWTHSDLSIGPALSISVSFDGCTVISGHQSGVITAWDVGRNGSSTSVLHNTLSGPVTNLCFLPAHNPIHERKDNLWSHELVKPKFRKTDSTSGEGNTNYALNFELTSNIRDQTQSTFQEALNHPSFPPYMLDTGINELFNWDKDSRLESSDAVAEEDFMALDDAIEGKPRELSVAEQNVCLKADLEALRRLQNASFEKIEKLSEEKRALVRREQRRLSNAPHTQTNGAGNIHGEVDGLSSSSDDG